MKTVAILISMIFVLSCSKNVDYTKEFINQTSGQYLFTPDEVIEVFYENEKLYLKWRNVQKIKPVIQDQNTFFIPDMYKKLRFVQHPNSKEWYLSIVDPENEDLVTYDYLKLADSIEIPSVHLKNGNYEKALEGYLEIKKQDSTSVLLDEGEFNRLGYDLLRDKKNKDAVDVFKMNVILFPTSSNVYDSLADAYVRSGDSLEAYINYKKALERDEYNNRAEKYIKTYNKKSN